MTSVGVMASSVVTGVCTDVLQEPFNNLTAWTISGATIVTGRTGTACQVTGSLNNAQYTIASGQQSDTLTIGFAFRWTDAGTGIRTVVAFRNDGTVAQNRLQLNPTTGVLTADRAGITLGTATGTLVVNTWYYIELQTKLHDTAGFMTVRVNGATVLNVTNIDTQNPSVSSVYEIVRLAPVATTTTLQFDDLYLSTGPGCAFQGDHTIP